MYSTAYLQAKQDGTFEVVTPHATTGTTFQPGAQGAKMPDSNKLSINVSCPLIWRVLKVEIWRTWKSRPRYTPNNSTISSRPKSTKPSAKSAKMATWPLKLSELAQRTQKRQSTRRPCTAPLSAVVVARRQSITSATGRDVALMDRWIIERFQSFNIFLNSGRWRACALRWRVVHLNYF